MLLSVSQNHSDDVSVCNINQKLNSSNIWEDFSCHTHTIRSSSDTSVQSDVPTEAKTSLSAFCIISFRSLKCHCFPYFLFESLKPLSFSLYFYVFLCFGTVEIRQHPQRFLQNDPNLQMLSSQHRAKCTDPQLQLFFFGHLKNFSCLHAKNINIIKYVGIKLFY